MPLFPYRVVGNKQGFTLTPYITPLLLYASTVVNSANFDAIAVYY